MVYLEGFKKIGLIAEGVTDLIVLENILCGYSKIPDFYKRIKPLQPRVDESTRKQIGAGGGHFLLNYLTIKAFRDAVVTYDLIIIQIDTDISKEFGVQHTDELGNKLNTETLVKNVIQKLISIIDSGKAGFYAEKGQNIIFAISVHSLECWLIVHYSNEENKVDCFDTLKTIIDPKKIRVAKKYKNYDQLSQPYLERQNIDAVAEKDISFKIFIQNLEKLTLQT